MEAVVCIDLKNCWFASAISAGETGEVWTVIPLCSCVSGQQTADGEEPPVETENAETEEEEGGIPQTSREWGPAGEWSAQEKQEHIQEQAQEEV